MMMYRTISLLLLILLIITGFNLQAQQKKPDDKSAQNNKKNTHIFKPPVFLGHSEYTGGPIKKEVFNNLMKQGLISKDSLGNRYRIVEFDFGYAERNLYEDSVGNLVAMMDYLSEHCPGDTLPVDITQTKHTEISNYLDGDPDSGDVSRSIYNRAKPGDTLYFDKIQVAKYISATQSLPDTSAILARSLKFWIVK